MKKVDGKSFLEYLSDNIMVLDGASGTYMQQNGMQPGVCPELFAIENSDVLKELQDSYIAAGSKALYTFTMGANSRKLKEYGLENEVYGINKKLAEISCGIAGDKAFVGGDVSSIGSFLAPLGDLGFGEAVEIYKQQIKALADGGVDFIIIETMIDISETRAAVIASKECCALPVVVSMTFDENARTLTGTTPAAAAITLVCAGADVVGLNCSTGPKEMIRCVEQMKKVSSVPIIVKPNAGMPKIENGNTVFDLSCEEFSKYIEPLINAGANLIGGCCGTGPDYIKAIAEKAKSAKPLPWLRSLLPVLSSVTSTMSIKEGFTVIGNGINAAVKPKLAEALKTGDYYEVLDMALDQRDSGADIICINVASSGLDELTAIEKSIEMLSSQAKVPLGIYSSDINVLEQPLRVLPGRALISSVSANPEHLKKLLPLIKRFGAMFVLFPSGASNTAEEIIEEFKQALTETEQAGISKGSVLLGMLLPTESEDKKAALELLKALKWGSSSGFITALEVSGSSGSIINQAYLALAAAGGLNAVILDPCDKLLMDICKAVKALAKQGESLEIYAQRFAGKAITEQYAKEIVSAMLSGKSM